MIGISSSILEVPSITLTLLETTFFQFTGLLLTPLSSSEKSQCTPLQRFWVIHLIDKVLDCNQFKPRQIRLINYCRLFLQVHTVADPGGYSR
jgi:hypothetical protein